MKKNSLNIDIPVYKTGYWTYEVVYLNCSNKIMVVKIPETKMVGFDSPEVVAEKCFSINLN